MLETSRIRIPHEFPHVCNELLSLVGNHLALVLSDGRVTDALKEFDALFTLQVLKVTILFDEVLLHGGNLLILQCERSLRSCVSLVADLRSKVKRAVHGVYREGLEVSRGVSLVHRELRILNFLEADTGTRRGAHGVFLIG